MFTKKNILIITVSLIVIGITIYVVNANKRYSQIMSASSFRDINITSSVTPNTDQINNYNKCLYINSLAINSKYLIDYFKNTLDIWFVNNNIITNAVTDTILFSTDTRYRNSNFNYIEITHGINLDNDYTIPNNGLLQIPPTSANDLNIPNNQDNVDSLTNIIIKQLSVQKMNNQVIYDTYRLIQNIKIQLLNILRNGTNAKGYIYNKIFSTYKLNNYNAFVIYIDYLHFSNIDNIVDIIQTIYNIIKNLSSNIPVNFIIELPRSLNKDDMNTKINNFVNNSSSSSLNMPVNRGGPTIRSLILGFNIVPDCTGNNNDISYYGDILTKYMSSSYKFYIDAGNCGQDNIFKNDNITQSIPLNPSNITNIHNIISYPLLINLLKNSSGSLIIDADANISMQYDKITLNICPYTDYLFGHYDNLNYYGYLVANNLNNQKITIISPLLPFFYKNISNNSMYEYTLLDEYMLYITDNNITDLQIIKNIINGTYTYITGSSKIIVT